MELHYIINPTMRPLAERFFLHSLPEDFEVHEHASEVWTSGNFDKDNYTKVLVERTDAILKQIENRMDGSLMFWCDVDIAFYHDCAAELTRLAEGNDLLFQKEFPPTADRSCNFGVQIIRRTPRNLIFYGRLALLQKITDNAHDQPWGNRLLGFSDAPAWAHLPLVYSSESNGGVRGDSVLYHANCTADVGSLDQKAVQLERAGRIAGKHER